MKIYLSKKTPMWIKEIGTDEEDAYLDEKCKPGKSFPLHYGRHEFFAKNTPIGEIIFLKQHKTHKITHAVTPCSTSNDVRIDKNNSKWPYTREVLCLARNIGKNYKNLISDSLKGGIHGQGFRLEKKIRDKKNLETSTNKLWKYFFKDKNKICI